VSFPGHEQGQNVFSKCGNLFSHFRASTFLAHRVIISAVKALGIFENFTGIESQPPAPDTSLLSSCVSSTLGLSLLTSRMSSATFF